MDGVISEPSREALRIGRFVDLVSEMLERSDYLLPLAAGQRQFRQDNYNMASAALLEDLFFDALGMFVRENHPAVALERRTGKEVWDYGVDGLRLSHKESLSANISVWWTAGDRLGSSRGYVPKPEYRTFTAEHPIVMVYSGCGALDWSASADVLAAPRLSGEPEPRSGTLVGSLGCRAIAGREAPGACSLVLARQSDPGTLLVERVWRSDEWTSLGFHDLWPILGGPGIGERDLWLDREYAHGRAGLGPLAGVAQGAELALGPASLLPGIYVVPASAMVDVPMVANNRAHSFDPVAVRELLLGAKAEGFYTAFPAWFAHFAVSQPPNLYAKQREQYEALFAARRRDTPDA
ncbi:hypothetical protein INN71_08760 [Nocardioides sp. ChNu-153]|uniref:hypothetical protein n=1 Tax=Nocardioides sp. ChNu-153 TaxID=2779364 RepID=UPI00264A674D|nr:hypothetical protein [Nocardioides sp. ChNu-153]MDN7121479.1 hypothetical protein [Nocardioides sp. ChNu-153]